MMDVSAVMVLALLPIDLFDNSDVITTSYCDDATSSYDGCLGSDGAGLASYRMEKAGPFCPSNVGMG